MRRAMHMNHVSVTATQNSAMNFAIMLNEVVYQYAELHRIHTALSFGYQCVSQSTPYTPAVNT